MNTDIYARTRNAQPAEATQYALRQQLSADSLHLMQQLITNERTRLERLHWEILKLASPPDASKVLRGIEASRKALWDAEAQLQAVFLDQFPAGREENDSKGFTGLKPPL